MNASVKQKRVLVPLRWPLGGIRTYIHYNYPALAEAGYRFTFVGPADASFRTFQGELQPWQGAEFAAAPVDGRRCRLLSTVRRLLRQGRFSLIHSQGLMAACQTVVANLGIGVPHIVTLHDVIRADQFCGRCGWAKRWLVGRLLRRADVLIAATEDARENHLDFFPGLGRGPCRLTAVLHGIDTARFRCPACRPADSLRLRLGLTPDVFLMGFLGRFMQQKGFLVLLDALELVVEEGVQRPFHLVAVGSGDYRRGYEAEVARRPGVARCVSFMDHVADVSSILAELDLVVMPSLWEACGLLAMEAMSMGVPVLGSDCPGLREVLRGSPSRMAAAGDAPALADALRRAIDAPWTDRARQYSRTAQERFDIARPAARLRGLFDELAAPLVCEGSPSASSGRAFSGVAQSYGS